MVRYPETNILIKPLDDKAIKCLNEIKTYLEINGTAYSQHSDNIDRPTRMEYHYFMGTSAVRIMEFSRRVDIKIVALGESYLHNIKKNIEKILNED
jgi:hypothetical protein